MNDFNDVLGEAAFNRGNIVSLMLHLGYCGNEGLDDDYSEYILTKKLSQNDLRYAARVVMDEFFPRDYYVCLPDQCIVAVIMLFKEEETEFFRKKEPRLYVELISIYIQMMNIFIVKTKGFTEYKELMRLKAEQINIMTKIFKKNYRGYI